MSMGSCFICGEYCNKLFNQKCHECRRHERFNKSESKQETRNQQAEPLTKREQFAAMAMQGMLSAITVDASRINPDTVAKNSIELADALLKALEADK
jgi:hypothetical protein